MATEATARAFFSQPYFAVVGASSDPAKFGHKIFAWYIHHSLPATPINPSTPSIAIPSLSTQSYPTTPSLSQLPHPAQTAVSIITPPKVTLKVLEEASRIGVKAVWLQPGAFDDSVLEYANGEGGFESVIAGDGGRGHEGWCVLVDGERAAKSAGKL